MAERSTHITSDEPQNTCLDNTIQLCMLVCCTHIQSKHVGEVCEAVEHEHRVIPCCHHHCLHRSLHGICCIALAHHIFLLCHNNTHLYGGIDKCNCFVETLLLNI